jgi:hypothetical protein
MDDFSIEAHFVRTGALIPLDAFDDVDSSPEEAIVKFGVIIVFQQSVDLGLLDL